VRPKKFNNKTKPKTVATTQHDLGFDSGYETKIIAMGFQGKESISTTSFQVVSSMKLNIKKK
jgi:hypothetical protein